MNTHVLSEIEMLANRVAIIANGEVVAQDELRKSLDPRSRNFYSVTFEANGVIPELSHLRRTGGQLS